MQRINTWRFIGIGVFFLGLLVNTNAQKPFYIKHSRLQIDTVYVENMDAMEYQHFVRETLPIASFYSNLKVLVRATKHRINSGLKVTNQTIEDMLAVYRIDWLIIFLSDNNYQYEPNLLLDIMAKEVLTIAAIMPEAQRKDPYLTENIEEQYNKVENDFLRDLAKMQEVNLKMGDFFYHRDTSKALMYYRKIFKFPYFKYRLHPEGDESNDFKMSGKLFTLHRKAFKQIIALYRGKKDKLEHLKNGARYYNYCCHKIPSIKKFFNECLIEVGLEPIE